MILTLTFVLPDHDILTAGDPFRPADESNA